MKNPRAAWRLRRGSRLRGRKQRLHLRRLVALHRNDTVHTTGDRDEHRLAREDANLCRLKNKRYTVYAVTQSSWWWAIFKHMA